MLEGMMMERPLLISTIIDYAAEVHRTGEVVSSTVEGGLHRYTYPEARARMAQLAHALRALGIRPGERIATLAWNGYRHLELYYAVSGIGAICHTINPRLFADQIVYMLGHADDRLLFTDLTFVPLLEKLKDRLPSGLRLVVLTDRAHMPASAVLGDLLCYEELLAGEAGEIVWPEMDERSAAGLCYTSGTTGDPKGALYSHRSSVLHALSCLIGCRCFGADRKIMPVVPLFHVNAWGLPYSVPLSGSTLVLPGPRLDGASLFDLMDGEGVTSAWGVPTVWLGLLAEMRARGRKPRGFAEVAIGGSAAPAPMIEAMESEFGVSVMHAWGMTEMSPIGTFGLLPPDLEARDHDERVRIKTKQGRRIFGVELKIVDASGHRQPHDGKAVGDLYVRGNTVISGYYANEKATAEAFDAEGWMKTGDVATIDGRGFLHITDRSKDLIKSGGEWISSIDLESAALGAPGVANCAVIAVAHPRWDERPLLVVVRKEGEAGAAATREAILGYLAGKLAKWQVPDDVAFLEALPMTATGKISKKDLRDQLGGWQWPA